MTTFDVTDTPKRLRVLLAALPLLGAVACNKTQAEPDPPPTTSVTAPAVKPLEWETPGTWTVLETPRGGPKKAVYKIPKAGADKEDAELNVLFFGTGANGDPEKIFGEMFTTFDGDAGSKAKREAFDVNGMKAETVEVLGTYKMGLTPGVGPKKKAAVQMVKENWRMLAAVVKTPDRGNWFFKITGPDETVQASRAALRTLLESAR